MAASGAASAVRQGEGANKGRGRQRIQVGYTEGRMREGAARSRVGRERGGGTVGQGEFAKRAAGESGREGGGSGVGLGPAVDSGMGSWRIWGQRRLRKEAAATVAATAASFRVREPLAYGSLRFWTQRRRKNG